LDVIKDVLFENTRAKVINTMRQSTGYDVGACTWSTSDWKKVALFYRSMPSVNVDSTALEALATILGTATAASFLSIDDVGTSFPLLWFAGPSAELASEPDRHGNVDLRVGRLTIVQAAFGLSSTELAGVCRVSRAALYKWLASDESLHLSPANWSRLSDLAKLAEEWNEQSNSPPGQLLLEPFSSGETLFSLLSGHQLDHGAIHSLFGKVAAMLSKRSPRRDEKLRQAGIKTRPLIGQLQKDE